MHVLEGMSKIKEIREKGTQLLDVTSHKYFVIFQRQGSVLFQRNTKLFI